MSGRAALCAAGAHPRDLSARHATVRALPPLEPSDTSAARTEGYTYAANVAVLCRPVPSPMRRLRCQGSNYIDLVGWGDAAWRR